MNNEIIRVIEIANEFLKIPSSISYEKPFLNYLNSKIQKLGYKTVLNDKYLVVKSKSSTPKYLFSAHIDRHAIIQNENKEIEYLGFYLKKEENATFKRADIEQDEIKLVKQLKQDGYQASLTNKHLKIGKDNISLRYIREGGEDFFTKVALRYVNEKVYSYREKTGQPINKFKIERFDVNHKIPIIKYQLNPKPRANDKIFSLISQIKVYDSLFYGQIDNVISVALMYYLLERTNFSDEIIFTTKEEIGESYNCVVDYLKNKKENIDLVVLDTSPYENFSKLENGSIILRRGDENGLFSLELVKKIEKIALKLSIPHKFKASDLGQTELGRIVKNTNGKFNGTTIQLPSKNYHTAYETSTLKCLENYLKIIKSLSE